MAPLGPDLRHASSASPSRNVGPRLAIHRLIDPMRRTCSRIPAGRTIRHAGLCLAATLLALKGSGGPERSPRSASHNPGDLSDKLEHGPLRATSTSDTKNPRHWQAGTPGSRG